MTYCPPALAYGLTRNDAPHSAASLPAARREFRQNVSRGTLTIADILQRVREASKGSN